MSRGLRRAGALVVLLAWAVQAAAPAAAAATAGVTATLFGAPARNYLRNPGFSGPDYWILKGEHTRYDAYAGRDGTGGVVLRPALDPGAEIVQTVGPALEPGLRYTVTAWVRALAPGSVAVVGVRWEGGHPRVFRGIDPEDGWVKIEFRFDAPTQPGWRQVVLTGSGEMVWDDIGLFEADSLEQRLAREWEERLSRGEPIYTGLVVNAKGTDLQRGMNPRIWDEDGQLVFAGIGANQAQMMAEGLVAYATDLSDGVAHPRLRVSDVYPLRLPLVVDAQGTRGLPRTDVVIGRADAERIREAVKEYDFLGRFAVVIVLDPLSGL
ncbi:MAG: hypothetical protein LOD85_08520 [Clostridia bacterium]|nr:hypothetical protein [Bacillota bacterium]MBO2520983.1 hypothetical protein [Bacillota bacterium]